MLAQSWGFALTFPINKGDECLVHFHHAVLIYGGKTVEFSRHLKIESMTYLMALQALPLNLSLNV